MRTVQTLLLLPPHGTEDRAKQEKQRTIPIFTNPGFSSLPGHAEPSSLAARSKVPVWRVVEGKGKGKEKGKEKRKEKQKRKGTYKSK